MIELPKLPLADVGVPSVEYSPTPKFTDAYYASTVQRLMEQGIAYGREQMREECVNVIEGYSAITAEVTDELIEVIKELK